MTIQADIQSLSPSALLELYVLDTTNLPGGGLAYFHAGTNALQLPVVWQGKQYLPLPIESDGFDVNSKGALPRPRIRVANVDGIFSAQVRQNDDLIGCKVTRKRTFARYLDAVNFPGGSNPSADPNQHFPDEMWIIDQKIAENKYMIEWELSSVFDLQGVMLPHRQVIQNSCSWQYRSAECGWTGVAYDKNDNPCMNEDDFCSKRLNSCRVRFKNGNLPFGGFPGAVRNG